MTLQTPGLSVAIAVSNMDLSPFDLPGRASWSSNLDELASHLERTGFHDFEVLPTDAIIQSVAEQRQRGDVETAGNVIGSVHQSFNHGGDLMGRVADWRGVHRSHESIIGMEAIAAAIGRPVNGVYYPDDLPRGKGVAPNDFIYSVMQPSAEVYRHFGVRSNAGLLRAMADIGISGLCPDTVHSRRRAEDGTRTPPIEEVWADQFASGRVFQMHVATDRYDMAKRDPEVAKISENEFQAFLAGGQQARRTEMGDMITAAVESWVQPAELRQAVGRPVLRMVTEIPPRPQEILRRAKQHSRFAESLAEVVREAGATPLFWGNAA